MPGPAPTYQPTFTDEAIDRVPAAGPPAHARPRPRSTGPSWRCCCTRHPTIDNVAAGRRLGKHENWVRYWRRIWATDGLPPDRPAGARAQARLSPLQAATVVALACELPAQRDEPLSRYSTAELARLVSAASRRPAAEPQHIWRILDRHALKPWRYRSWLFPRDPQFAAKAGRVLDLYAGWWEGAAVGPGRLRASAPTRRPASRRAGAATPTTPPRPGQRDAGRARVRRGAGRWPTWPPGTCGAAASSAAARRPRARRRSAGWSTR